MSKPRGLYAYPTSTFDAATRQAARSGKETEVDPQTSGAACAIALLSSTHPAILVLLSLAILALLGFAVHRLTMRPLAAGWKRRTNDAENAIFVKISADEPEDLQTYFDSSTGPTERRRASSTRRRGS